MYSYVFLHFTLKYIDFFFIQSGTQDLHKHGISLNLRSLFLYTSRCEFKGILFFCESQNLWKISIHFNVVHVYRKRENYTDRILN